MNQIKLGQVVKDRITGYKGVVISETRWLNGCLRYMVQSQKLVDDKPTEAQCFDVEQLEVLTKEPAFEPNKPGGGPMPAPKRY